jgi:atypical dual specificity phosphatase
MDVIIFCQENNFHSCFFDGTESNMIADAHELKVGCKNVPRLLNSVSKHLTIS